MEKKRIIGCIAGVVLGFALPFLLAGSGLQWNGCVVLGILAGAICWWVGGVLPEFATALLMALLFVAVAGIPLDTVFAMFSQSTWWLLVSAFAIGYGMKSTGLLRRMALAVLSRFPTSFKSETAGFIAVGTVLGPLIPSAAAKVSMLGPLATSIGEVLGYEPKGRRMTGLFLSMFTGVQNICPAVISSSVIGYALLAIYPESVQQQFGYLQWFLAALPWFICVTVLNYLALNLMYGHERRESGKVAAKAAAGEPAAVSRPAANGGSHAGALKEHIASQRAELGAMSRAEKAMAVIVIATVVLWATQQLHGIQACIIAIGALVAMVACGIVDKKSISSGINWGSLVFIGIVLGLGGVFAAAGINEWLAAQFAPAFSALASNPYVFMVAVALATVACRFLIVSQIAFINVFMVIVIPLAMQLGINPWVIGMAAYAVISPWFAKYQNPIYLAAYYSVDEGLIRHADLSRYCVVYTALAIASLLAATPVWQMMGLFG